MAPRPKKSRSPPCAAEPVSSEFLRARSAKLAGFLRTSASSASALALAFSRSAAGVLVGLDQDVAGAALLGLRCSALAFSFVVLAQVGSSGTLEVFAQGRQVQHHVFDAPPARGRLELLLVGLVVGLELGIGGVDLGCGRRPASKRSNLDLARCSSASSDAVGRGLGGQRRSGATPVQHLLHGVVLPQLLLRNLPSSCPARQQVRLTLPSGLRTPARTAGR
jgi:hypothetical protein